MHGLSKQEYPAWVKFILMILRGWLVIYDILAFLPFKYLASPVQKLLRSNRVKAKPLVDGDFSSPFRSTECPNGQLVTKEFPGCDTLDKIFERAVKVFSGRDCLGYREVISLDLEKQPNGRMFEKFVMGDYHWFTYEDLKDMVYEIGVVVTVYATLGEDAIVSAINETEAVSIFTSHELVEKTMKILPRCTTLKRLIYFESHLPNAKILERSQFHDLPNGFGFMSFHDLMDLGDEESPNLTDGPTPGDVAVIIYTSGTTGKPKGVIVTHANLVAANYAQTAYVVPELKPPDIFVAYLPLAHVLELTLEFGCITHGVRVGYSSPLTLTDNSSKIKIGAKGDITVLRPTLMAAVPTIMDRIYKTVVDKVEHSTPFSRALFEFLYELKRGKIESGYDTPFLNRFIFKKIRAVLGGRIRLMLSGGAPLNHETQRFMNICFCCPVGQGYGLTETCGAGCVMNVDDLNTGRVGPPLRCSDIMLRNWDEGGYTTNNRPYPQGEIFICGANVCAGYYKNPEKTREDFVQIDGRRWFATGDIGEFLWDGTLKIIDRKKDLLKLQHGEYVSLNKVESTLLTCPMVDNCCVVGDSNTLFVVVLIVPNRKQLEALGQKLHVNIEDFDALRLNKKVCNAVLKQLQEHSKQSKLDKFETVEKVYLVKEIWTNENGLLTDALKLKRKPVEKFYEKELKQLYCS